MTYPPQGPYGQQPGPYGQQPGPYGQQQPDPYAGGYPQQPTGQYGPYDQSTQYGGVGYPQYGGVGGPPPQKKNTGAIIAVVSVVVLLLGGLGITGFVAPGFFLSDDDNGGTATTNKGGDSGQDDFVDKLVATADKKDKSALRDLACENADEHVEDAIKEIDEIDGAKLKDTTDKTDNEVTVILSITYEGDADDYAALVSKDGDSWCWQNFARGTDPRANPSATGGAPTASKPADDDSKTASEVPQPSTEAPGGGGAGDSEGEQFVQTFLDKLNAGDGPGAAQLLCPDSTSQGDITEAAGKSPSLAMDPAGTTADSSYVGADLKGTLDGAAVTGRTSAFLEDAGWCIYTFYAF